MKSLILLAVVALAAAMPLADEWKDFKTRYGKSYETEQEELHRNAVWQSNKKYIDTHNANADKFGFTLRMNEFGDLEDNEFVALYNGYRMEERKNTTNKLFVRDPNFVPLADVDWRNKGAVTPVKNQGQCGSCWSFSATGSLEGQHFLKAGRLVSLSEQNLVDCSFSDGNQGCMGGLMDSAFRYVEKTNGVDTEASYPYQGHDETCRFKPQDVGATCSGLVDIDQTNEDALAEAIQVIGPISVAMDASLKSFHFYKSGVYSDSDCSSEQLDHGVLAVGFGSESGKDYYIVKNSWGTQWGLEGYFKIARNDDNMCGLATRASYPIVE